MAKQTSRTKRAAPAPDDVVLGRYRLVDKVGDRAGTALWRGYDDRLKRPVSVRFVPLEDPQAAELRRAALRASHVTDRRAVHVLDAVTDDTCGCLVIVTEWLAGTSYAQRLAERRGDPLPEREATVLALEVARTLQAAAADGAAELRAVRTSVAGTSLLPWHTDIRRSRKATLAFLDAKIAFLAAGSRDYNQLNEAPPGVASALDQARVLSP